MKIIVIGAGMGGLAAAAALARRGADVTVLEAHVYPGGCAGTFYHQGYRFEAGATLAAGFYPGGPMDLLAQAAGIEAWPVHPADAALTAHLPGGLSITRYGDARRWDEYQAAFGPAAERFFAWQESAADALWPLALRRPPWPPNTLAELLCLPAYAHPGLLPFAADALRPAAIHLRGAPAVLRLFVDGQLLIAAQAESERANALYAAAALDLPRRGVAHVAGGMGALAERLVQAIRTHGGQVIFRQEVTRLAVEPGRPIRLEMKRGELFHADRVIANLTPWDVRRLLGEAAPPRLARLPDEPPGWGAFVAYVGVDATGLPADLPLHQQVIVRRPLGEGNSLFLSLSPAWDATRAPSGQRALTISTHTALGSWWRLYEQDRPAYEARKQATLDALLAAAETALPGLRSRARLTMPGTPLTFAHFTRRHLGWVGGFPQTSLLRTGAPHLLPNLWLVGDSIFPGQSVAAVALGGLRVAAQVLPG
jgi:C-3',4' desaturase CrtD